MRTLEISKKSVYLRVFLWLWKADPEKLDICKFFWGTIFFPVTLMSWNRDVYRFIPRIFILYFLIGSVNVLIGGWSGIGWWIVGLIALIISYFADLIKKRSARKEVRQEDGERKLSKIAEKCGDATIWIFDHTLGYAVDFSENVTDSRVGHKIGGFFSVSAQYFWAFKHRHCARVQVVD